LYLCSFAGINLLFWLVQLPINLVRLIFFSNLLFFLIDFPRPLIFNALSHNYFAFLLKFYEINQPNLLFQQLMLLLLDPTLLIFLQFFFIFLVMQFPFDFYLNISYIFLAILQFLQLAVQFVRVVLH